MTNDEINKLEAGRELDALVAEKVMGISVIFVPPFAGWSSGVGDYCIDQSHAELGVRKHGGPIPTYSTDIAAAEQVINKLRERYAVQIMYWPNMVELTLYNQSATKILGSIRSSTAPLAICLTALKAVSPSP